jgi:hypothetical protein
MNEYKHEDYLKQPLEIGDYVVAAPSSTGAPVVDIYVIQKFVYTRYHENMESKAIVNLEMQRLGMQRKRTTVRTSDEVVKIPGYLLTYKELMHDPNN